MAALRTGLEEAGCTDVVTYIQSGNVVLTPPRAAAKDLQSWLDCAVTEIAGFDVAVVVRTTAEIQRTVARSPFPDASGSQLHVVFLRDAPPKSAFDGIDLPAFAPEELSLVGKDLY